MIKNIFRINIFSLIFFNVLYSQMIIDVEVNKNYGGKNYITFPKPVLQRMIDVKQQV